MRLLLLTGVIAIVLTGSRPAHAYLDPGSISMLIQGLVAALVGGLVVVRMYWSRLRHLLFRRGKHDQANMRETT